MARIKKRIPMAEDQLQKVRELFDLYDSDSDNSLNLNELAVLLQEVGNKITALPAVRLSRALRLTVFRTVSLTLTPWCLQTAQVASQQGKYLGKKLSKIAARREVLEANGVGAEGADDAVAQPFRYTHLGSLAYIGNAAVFDLGRFSFMGGLAAMYAWRSVYWSEQVSMRTRALLMIDWVCR